MVSRLYEHERDIPPVSVEPSAEIAALRARVSSLEIEREDLVRQVDEMFVLQQILSTLNSTLDLDNVLETVMRGVREVVAFDRVVLFEVSERGVHRHLETNAAGDVVSGFLSPQPRRTPAFEAMIAGKESILTGTMDEDLSPVEGDVGSGWCMAALTFRGEVRGILYVDRPRTVEIAENQFRMLLDFATQAAIAIENGRLFRETQRLYEEASRLAMTDALTGLANRRALEEAMDREIANAARRGASLAIMLLDIDDLKRINDGPGGHAAGDAALCGLAAVLLASSRRGDMAGRWAGDEFMIMLAEADYREGGIVASRLYDALHAAGNKVSGGLAIFPVHGRTVSDLVASADRGLYAAKRLGKDRWEYGGPSPTLS